MKLTIVAQQVFCLITTCHISLLFADFYSAVIHLKPLIDTNNLIVKKLDNYANREESVLSLSLKYSLSLYKQISDESAHNADKHLENPINAFKLIKRLTRDWNLTKSLLIDSDSEPLIDAIESAAVFPSADELNEASLAVIRLVKTYKLGIAEVADGVIESDANRNRQLIRANSSALTRDDCFELGKQAFDYKAYNESIAWLRLALERPDQWSTESQHQIQDYLDRALRLKITAEESDIFADIPQIESVCRGESGLNASVESRLYCEFLDTRATPYLRLTRVRVEHLLLEPPVMLFYDMISRRETRLVQSLARPALKRATAYDAQSGEKSAVKYRVSQTTFFGDRTHRVFQRLSTRVKLVTGLETSTAEPLQVGNYGIGGYYAPHHDFFRAHIPGENMVIVEHGNRAATWMFYLSDVDAGGATVFPRLNVTVWPVRGSALFWFNLFKSGSGDERTLHAACPVLVGSKWVANKWIYEFGQEFRRKCGLDSSE